MNYLWLFLEFLKIGVVSFGGGYGMIPFVKESVLSHGWISEDIFYDFIGVCESTPGPIAVNMATYIGTTVGGPLGAVIATIGVILPAFIIILILSLFMDKFLKNKQVKGALSAIQPTVIGLIVSAGFVLLFNSLFMKSNGYTFRFEYLGIFLLISAIAFGFKLVKNKSLSTVAIILIGASLGLIYGLTCI